VTLANQTATQSSTAATAPPTATCGRPSHDRAADWSLPTSCSWASKQDGSHGLVDMIHGSRAIICCPHKCNARIPHHRRPERADPAGHGVEPRCAPTSPRNARSTVGLEPARSTPDMGDLRHPGSRITSCPGLFRGSGPSGGLPKPHHGRRLSGQSTHPRVCDLCRAHMISGQWRPTELRGPQTWTGFWRPVRTRPRHPGRPVVALRLRRTRSRRSRRWVWGRERCAPLRARA